jgi:ArsR family transcriptional regulator
MNTVNFAKAIADETRQKIMAICCCTQITVSEIVEQMEDISQPTVSHHLKILKQAGLVHTRRNGKEIFYSLNQEALAKGCCQVAESFAPNIDLTLTPIKGE